MHNIFQQLAVIIIYILLGIYLRKIKKIPKETGGILSTIIVGIMLPCTIVNSFLKMEVGIPLKEIVVVLIAASLMFVLLSIIAKTTGLLFRLTQKEKGIWEFALMFSNNIFMGFPIIEAIFGKQALIYASLACIPCNTLMFSYGIYLIAKGEKKYQHSWGELINSCMAASAVAVLLLIFPIELPEVLANVIESMGNMASPLAMIVLGFAMADSLKLSLLKTWRTYVFCFLRLLAAPFVISGILQIVFPEHRMITGVLAVTAAMPASNTVVLMSEKYENDTEFAVKCVTVSTMLFMITAPALTCFSQI